MELDRALGKTALKVIQFVLVLRLMQEFHFDGDTVAVRLQLVFNVD